jgi:hypothetical protein
MRYVLMFALIASLSGCVPYSDNPLTDPGQQPMDASVYGSWYWKDNNEVGYVHMGLDRESKLLRVFMIDFGKDGEMHASELAGHTSSFPGQAYLNLKWVSPSDENPGYLFVKYEVRGDVLEISLMDNEAAEKAIQEGSLKGEIISAKWFSTAHIMEEKDALQQFVAKHNEELFKEKSPLHRLNPPDAPAAR